MNKNLLVVGITILFLGISVAPLTQGIITEVSNYPISDGNTLYVGGTGEGNYTRIQDAIDNASDEDTVYVYSGFYLEIIKIKRSIKLIGEDKYNTIIDSNDTFIKSTITIKNDSVTISNFTIQNGSTNGIKIYSSYNTISNNIITQNNYGINIYGDFITAKDNLILNNQIINNSRGGIELNHWVAKTTISHNVIRNSPESVDFDKTENIISYNLIENAGDIEFFRASNNLVENNVIISGHIELHDSSLIKVKNNTFFDSRGIVIEGEDIEEWDTHTIENNSINGKPIYFYKHAAGLTIPSDAGGVILVGCTQCVINSLLDEKSSNFSLMDESPNVFCINLYF